MEFILTTTLSIVSLLLSLHTSAALQNVEPLSLDEQAYNQLQVLLPKLPRKLLHEEVLTDPKYGFQDTILYKQQKKDISGKHKPGEQKAMMHGSKGTWKEWMEGSTDASHFFTMDYTHVKRRRPIHNKSLPVSP
ncbi:hypothetical protein HS088_TW07G00925 [Tripterygium wilfordii]|uniref:Root meristem growth factor 8 n=1 Tax=Tripterygium wilfordii TaxID=458696 RepID=A0A7J7DG75_TRIWF|nr:probable root meristem growth factor 8 [Tripterygium wilfordii]KAF5745341.1 hypothetical protein HS088_TW07G00925 [Tripterygium wilfordii]